MKAASQQRRMLAGLSGLAVLAVVLFGAALAFGSVHIPFTQVLSVVFGGDADQHAWEIIVRDIRLPRAITASLVGAALALAGMQMQTMLRNPLADPFTLGVSSGASLGVALVVLTAGAGSGFAANLAGLQALGTTAAAAAGAALVVVLVLAVAHRVQSTVTVLLVGLMVGYVVASVVSLLVWFADDARTSAYITWGFGSFRGTTWEELRIFAPVVAGGAVVAVMLVRRLNVLLLGERYAESLGVAVRPTRAMIIVSSAVLAGTVTAFAGPIGFIGIAVPHAARSLLQTSDHRIIAPASVLLGVSMALAAELVAQVPGADVTLPINAVTALLGAPVVAWIILRSPSRTAFS